MIIRMNGSSFSGTPDEIVEKIRQGWMWTPIPTLEELFKTASDLLKRPITNAQEYIDAMVKMGIAKIEEETHGV